MSAEIWHAHAPNWSWIEPVVPVVLYCNWLQVQDGLIGLKGVPEDENVPVTFECLAIKGVDETVAALRLLEGVEVGRCCNNWLPFVLVRTSRRGSSSSCISQHHVDGLCHAGIMRPHIPSPHHQTPLQTLATHHQKGVSLPEAQPRRGSLMKLGVAD